MHDRERVKYWTLSIFTFGLVFLPLYLYYRRFRVGAAFYFLAGDAFYYLDVARYSQGHSFFTFDGLHATNGFHPLWQYLLTWLAHFPTFSFAGHGQIAHFFLLDLVIVSIGYGLLSVFVAKQLRFFWLVPLALCPGFTWFLFSIVSSNYLSAWSYVNGMESGLSLLFFGLVLLFFDRKMPEGWKLYLGAFFLGLAVLSRLDDVFFLLALFAYSVWQAPQRRVRAALPYLAPFLMIAAYLLYNRIAVGTYLPVSGATKTSLALGKNILCPIAMLLPLTWDKQHASFMGFSTWAEFAIRLVQMWFPIFLCGGYLIVAARRRSLHNRPVLSCLCAGTLLKGLYNLACVDLWDQGHWYYPISIFTCNVLLAVLLDRTLQRLLYNPPLFVLTPPRRVAVLSFIAIFSWFSFFCIVSHKTAEQWDSASWRIYTHGPQIASELRTSGATSYLEEDDGQVSYATGIPGVSAFNLAIDVEAVEARKHGAYLDLMNRRGVHSLVTVASNVLVAGCIPRSGLLREDCARYSFDPVLRDEDNDIAIYRIVKKAPAEAIY
jgi:hypothetical protein